MVFHQINYMIVIKNRTQRTALAKISFFINGIEIPENEYPFHHTKRYFCCVFDVTVMKIMAFF
jgi:hypothetical protein